MLRARPLGPREQAEVAGLLGPGERELFWAQPTADRRHGLSAARLALRAAPGRRDLAKAALLHDVGKRHAGLGPFGRAVASVYALARLTAPGRLGDYLNHGPRGAAELAAAGSEGIVVEFARTHHDRRPPGIAARDWAVLQDADRE